MVESSIYKESDLLYQSYELLSVFQRRLRVVMSRMTIETDTQTLHSISDDQLSKNLAKYSLLLQKLTTLSQVNKLSNVIASDHENTSQNLNSYIQESQLKHNKELRKYELTRVDLTTTLSNFQTSLSNIAVSNNAAKSIYSDINTTDQEFKYLDKTLTFLRDIRTLKNNISLINSALEESNYIMAARAIDEVRQLPPNIIASDYAKSLVPSAGLPTEPQELINDWCTKLRDIFKENFEKAVANKDIDQLSIFFKLFPLIGEPKLGLDIYSKYICEIISTENKKILEGAMKFNAGFNAVLLHLFKTVSMVINEHSKVIENCYGVEYLTTIMEKIEKETELQATLVLNYFVEQRKPAELVKKISKIKESKTQNQDSEDDEDSIEKPKQIISLNELDSLINEYSQILQNWSMYARLFSVKWVEFSSNKSLKDPLTLPSPIIDGNFLSKLHKEHHIANFQLLLFKFLNDSFTKFVSLEEMPSLNSFITLEPIDHKDQGSWPMSSVLEDLTLLVRKGLIYSLNTGNLIIFSNFLDKLIMFIQNEYLVKFIQAKFKSLQAKLPSSSSTSFVVLRRYIPKSETDVSDSKNPSRLGSPSYDKKDYHAQNASKLSQFSKFDFRNAFANIQSNLQSVVISEENADGSATLALHHFSIYINTLFFTDVTIKKLLASEILEENPRLLPDNFPFNDDASVLVEKIGNCQTTILTQISKLSTWSIKLLFERVISNRLKLLFKKLFVNNGEFNDYGDEDEDKEDDSKLYVSNIENFEDLSNMNEFVNKWRTLITPFQNVLYEEAFNQLLRLVVNYSSKVIEKKIWSLQVNELGAIKLDRELSLFINTVCGNNYSSREAFVRCSQIVLLLGFDDDDFDIQTGDIKEEISNTMDWMLKPQERINTRDLMVDKRH